MKIEIDINKLEHLKDKSFYNHNYYLLNFKILDCDIIMQKCAEDTEELRYIFGIFEKDEFIKKIYLNIPFSCEQHYDIFCFDDKDLSMDDKLT